MKLQDLEITIDLEEEDLGIDALLDSIKELVRENKKQVVERMTEVCRTPVTRQMVERWFASTSRTVPSTKLFLALVYVVSKIAEKEAIDSINKAAAEARERVSKLSPKEKAKLEKQARDTVEGTVFAKYIKEKPANFKKLLK